MPSAVPLLAALCLSASFAAERASREAPSYSATSIVNGASFLGGPVAPNTFITIYGKDLAYGERKLIGTDIQGGRLPTILSGTGLRVWVNHIAAFIYYVSPTQINALLPTILTPGPAEVQVQLDSTWGPVALINLVAASPALFQLDGATVIATHTDGALITTQSPAAPGEWIALYATGLGETTPGIGYAEIPTGAAWVRNFADFRVLLNGERVDGSRVGYAGVAPGFGGLYQINLHLPDAAPRDPQIQIALGDAVSPPNLKLLIDPDRKVP